MELKTKEQQREDNYYCKKVTFHSLYIFFKRLGTNITPGQNITKKSSE